MGNFVFNISKGRVAELFRRVDANDPADAKLLIIPCSGVVADDTLNNADDFAAVITAGLTELSGTSTWARKTLTDADVTMPAPDDTNNRIDLDIADQTWTSVASGNSTRLVICYTTVASPANPGDNANLVPLTCHDFAVTADGSNVTAVIDTAGFYRAS